MLRAAQTAGSVKPRRRTETKLKDRKGPRMSHTEALTRCVANTAVCQLMPFDASAAKGHFNASTSAMRERQSRVRLGYSALRPVMLTVHLMTEQISKEHPHV
ncbi:MAG: hypothetical protein IKG52_11615 [Rhodobacteraceae bacterium]|nr:hypothetical protein [Paracoccaceae bacterium]